MIKEMVRTFRWTKRTAAHGWRALTLRPNRLIHDSISWFSHNILPLGKSLSIMVHITRKEHFNAAHRLFRPDFSDEKNLEVFGKCSNPNWHGHNYVLYVTVKGPINPETGFVVNLKDLSKLIREKVIEKIDHRNMNVEVDFMHGKLASAENMAIAIWAELEQGVGLLGAELHCIRIHETENNIVEYFGY